MKRLLCLMLTLTLLWALFLPAAHADTAENIAIVYEYLTRTLGYNRAAACGIMANIQYESNFRPTAVGDSGNAYGICQWNSRRESLKKHAYNYYVEHYGAEAGDLEENWKDIYAQLSYLGYELNNNKKSVGTYLRNVPDTAQGAYDAAYYFCVYFEIPADRYNKGATRGKAAVNKYYPMYGGNCHTYTLSFEGLGGSGVPSKISKTEGIPATIPASVPVLPGYAFDGWSADPQEPAAYQPGDSFNENADTVLYAVWVQTSFSDLDLSLDEGGYTVIGYSGSDKQVTIPSEINALPVTGIDWGAFLECGSVQCVYIPESVTYISEEAFPEGIALAACPGGIAHEYALTYGFRFISVYPDGSFRLDGSLRIIEAGAFTGLHMACADFSDTCLTRIESGAFAGCDRLTLVSLPVSVSYIAEDAFEKQVMIIAPPGSYALSFAEANGYPYMAG